MAKVGEDEVEYESDPEEETRPLGLRRREAASDDEDAEVEEKPEFDRRAPIHSDESDGQGGAAEYDDDEEEELDGEVDEAELYGDEEEVYEEEVEVEVEEVDGGKDVNEERGGGSGAGRPVGVEEKELKRRNGGDEMEGKSTTENHNGEEVEGEEGKKENEPFAVPTAGAFYMHDDRFRENTGGRHRRTYGGRKLWESKDDKKWGHDKFEEMTMQERHHEQGRRASRGNYRGHGEKSRGLDRGHARKNRSRTFSNGSSQTQAPKVVRGRGFKRYEHALKNGSQPPPTRNKQPGKPLDKSSPSTSGRVFTQTSNPEAAQVPPTKIHSSLNSASPPFYPSGSSNKDITLTQKGDVQAGGTSRNLRTPAMDESFSMRRKNIVDSLGIDQLYIDDSVMLNTGKSLNNMQIPPGSSLVNTIQSSESRAQGRDVSMSGQIAYQPISSHNQANRVSPTTQLHAGQRKLSQNRLQPVVQAPTGSQASSPLKTSLPVDSYESGDVDASSESGKSRNALVGKNKGGVQGSGRGSFLYGGAQVMGATGNVGVGGDQNFPAFLPVMQFGGQHPGGIGLPAVGMAFPGYVAQPQLGLGNSEMTWLPVLTGAAGALGANYCSPYIAIDGAYHARPSEQASSAGSSSKENNTNKPDNEWKSSQRPALVGDEYGQRQKPRRYSEMDFKQPSTSN